MTNHHKPQWFNNCLVILWFSYHFPSFSQLFPSCLVVMTQVMTPDATTHRHWGWDYLQHLKQRQCCLYSTLRSSKMAMGKSSIPDLVRWFSHRLTLPDGKPEGKPDSDDHSCGKPWTLLGRTPVAERSQQVRLATHMLRSRTFTFMSFVFSNCFISSIQSHQTLPDGSGWWIR